MKNVLTSFNDQFTGTKKIILLAYKVLKDNAQTAIKSAGLNSLKSYFFTFLIILTHGTIILASEIAEAENLNIFNSRLRLYLMCNIHASIEIFC